MNYQIEFVYQKLRDDLKKKIIEFWIAEGALKEAQAQKRIEQVALVAQNEEGEIIGVSTIFKQFHPPVGLYFWFFRAFVGTKYRRSGIVLDFLKASQKELGIRFNQGYESDVLGILIKIQNPDLMKGLYQAVLPRTGFVFIGKEEGCHVRISYFDNARID